jgi:hypothetical protein
MRKNRNNGNHPTTEGLRRKWSEDGGAVPGCGLGLKGPDLEAIGRRVRGNSLNSAEEEGTMKLKDIFVPRYLNSDSKVRMNLIKSTSDVKLLRSMAENDVDASVRKAAAERAEMLTMGQPHTA